MGGWNPAYTALAKPIALLQAHVYLEGRLLANWHKGIIWCTHSPIKDLSGWLLKHSRQHPLNKSETTWISIPILEGIIIIIYASLACQSMPEGGKKELIGFHFPFQHVDRKPSLSPWEHTYVHMCLYDYVPFAFFKKPYFIHKNSLHVWDLWLLLIEGLNTVIRGWLNDFHSQ